jgi:hypothetical protein
MMMYEVLWASNDISGSSKGIFVVDSNAAPFVEEKTQELVEPKRPILLRHLLCHLSGPQTWLAHRKHCFYPPVKQQFDVEHPPFLRPFKYRETIGFQHFFVCLP